MTSELQTGDRIVAKFHDGRVVHATFIEIKFGLIKVRLSNGAVQCLREGELQSFTKAD